MDTYTQTRQLAEQFAKGLSSGDTKAVVDLCPNWQAQVRAPIEQIAAMVKGSGYQILTEGSQTVVFFTGGTEQTSVFWLVNQQGSLSVEIYSISREAASSLYQPAGHTTQQTEQLPM